MFLHFYSNFNYCVCYSHDFNKSVRYIHEISIIKDAKPNQEVDFVPYKRKFVTTVIVITEFDSFNKECIIFRVLKDITLFTITNLSSSKSEIK